MNENKPDNTQTYIYTQLPNTSYTILIWIFLDLTYIFKVKKNIPPLFLSHKPKIEMKISDLSQNNKRTLYFD